MKIWIRYRSLEVLAAIIQGKSNVDTSPTLRDLPFAHHRSSLRLSARNISPEHSTIHPVRSK
jgi:hypothetical protein